MTEENKIDFCMNLDRVACRLESSLFLQKFFWGGVGEIVVIP